MNLLYKGRHLPDLRCATKENLRDFFYAATHVKDVYNKRHSGQDGWWRFSSFMKKYEDPIRAFELFYQPSTRTYFTTKTAMELLGGKVDGVTDPTFSSVAKGESLKATIRTLAGIGYQLIVLRYNGKEENVSWQLADMCEDEHITVSIVCAGESNAHHPMQALCDSFTVFELKKEDFLAGRLMYAVVGDLSDSRTIHDFLDAISHFGARKIYAVGGLLDNLPEWVLALLRERSVEYQKTSDLLSIAPEVDVWYFTRYQQEYKWIGWLLKKLKFLRLVEKYWYARWYGVSDKLLAAAKPKAIFLHPLPHGLEYPENIHLWDDRFRHYDPMILNSLITKMTLFKNLPFGKT